MFILPKIIKNCSVQNSNYHVIQLCNKLENNYKTMTDKKTLKS